MTKEEKDLLLKDLCARVPYKTRVRYTFAFAGASAITEYSDEGILSYEKLQDFSLPNLGLEKRCVAHILPYLRPISSMTEEEQVQLGRLLGTTSFNLLKGEYSSLKDLLEYSYKNHIDLFGLIPKGLALEAPEGMYENNI